jgi:AcrR family transcriptional regulator
MASIERVAELADAALRIVVRDGMSAVSFRAVAAESGWSLGAVQKAFASKQELLEAVVQRAQDLVVTDVSRAPGEPDLHTWLVGLVLQMLPLDGPRRAAVLVGVAYADRAGVDPALGAALAQGDAGIRGMLTALVARSRSRGEIAPALADDDVVRAVLALASGHAAQLLYDPRPEAEVRAHVAAVLAVLLGMP